jgi:pimeloyl-ACP methyl ester carboxylesterase
MARFDSIVGKYVYVEVQGIEYRVYFEENGKGIPLVCQHTAGADGQQWRHLLNNEEITSKYRVVVPDLPYHGKSLPPESVEWWKEEYRATMAFLMNFHVAFNHALGLEKPVFLGVSVGGNLAPDLALGYPDEFRAVIGVESTMGGQGRDSTLECQGEAETVISGQSTMAWWHHPRISDDFKAAAMFYMMGPSNPEKYRRETAWKCSQCTPAVFTGDIYYYFIEHDLTGKAQQIDTSRVSVYFLTGDSDPAVSVEDTRHLAEQIKGAKLTEMKGLGHFAMSENFEAFKRYLMPILDEIAMKESKSEKREKEEAK